MVILLWLHVWITLLKCIFFVLSVCNFGIVRNIRSDPPRITPETRRSLKESLFSGREFRKKAGRESWLNLHSVLKY